MKNIIEMKENIKKGNFEKISFGKNYINIYVNNDLNKFEAIVESPERDLICKFPETSSIDELIKKISILLSSL